MRNSYCSKCAGDPKQLPGYATFHQLHLGASEDGQLTLIRRQIRRPAKTEATHTHPSHSPLTQIPEEVLIDIFRIAIAGDWEIPTDYACALTLSTICKFFHRIMQPLLFENIQFEESHRWVPACKPARRLHRTIKASPILGTLCKSVKVNLPSRNRITAAQYNLGSELLSWMPNVTSLAVSGGFGYTPTWPFIERTLQGMPHVKSLTFNRVYFDFFLAPVLKILQERNLESVTLGGICPPEGGVIIATMSQVSTFSKRFHYILCACSQSGVKVKRFRADSDMELF